MEPQELEIELEKTKAEHNVKPRSGDCKLCWYSSSRLRRFCISSWCCSAACCATVCQKSRIAERTGSQNQSDLSCKSNENLMMARSCELLCESLWVYSCYQLLLHDAATVASSTTLAAAISRSPTLEPDEWKVPKQYREWGRGCRPPGSSFLQKQLAGETENTSTLSTLMSFSGMVDILTVSSQMSMRKVLCLSWHPLCWNHGSCCKWWFYRVLSNGWTTCEPAAGAYLNLDQKPAPSCGCCGSQFGYQ